MEKDKSRLQEIRRAKGMTQVDLANKARISVQWIQKIEQGWTSGVSEEVKRRLASALEASVWDLFPELRREIEIFNIVKTWFPKMKKEEELFYKEVLSRMTEEEISEIVCSGMTEDLAFKLMKKFAKKYGIEVVKQ